MSRAAHRTPHPAHRQFPRQFRGRNGEAPACSRSILRCRRGHQGIAARRLPCDRRRRESRGGMCGPAN